MRYLNGSSSSFSSLQVFENTLIPFEPFIYCIEFDLPKNIKKYWKIGIDSIKQPFNKLEKNYCIEINNILNNIINVVQFVMKSKILHMRASFAIWIKESGSIEVWLIGCEHFHFEKTSKDSLIVEGKILNKQFKDTSYKQQNPLRKYLNRTKANDNVLNKKSMPLNITSRLHFIIQRNKSKEINLVATTAQWNMKTHGSYIENDAYKPKTKNRKRHLTHKGRLVFPKKVRTFSIETRGSTMEKQILCHGRTHLLRFTTHKPITHQDKRKKLINLRLKSITEPEELTKPKFSITVTKPKQSRNTRRIHHKAKSEHSESNDMI